MLSKKEQEQRKHDLIISEAQRFGIALPKNRAWYGTFISEDGIHEMMCLIETMISQKDKRDKIQSIFNDMFSFLATETEKPVTGQTKMMRACSPLPLFIAWRFDSYPNKSMLAAVERNTGKSINMDSCRRLLLSPQPGGYRKGFSREAQITLGKNNSWSGNVITTDRRFNIGVFIDLCYMDMAVIERNNPGITNLTDLHHRDMQEFVWAWSLTADDLIKSWRLMRKGVLEHDVRLAEIRLSNLPPIECSHFLDMFIAEEDYSDADCAKALSILQQTSPETRKGSFIIDIGSFEAVAFSALLCGKRKAACLLWRLLSFLLRYKYEDSTARTIPRTLLVRNDGITKEFIGVVAMMPYEFSSVEFVRALSGGNVIPR